MAKKQLPNGWTRDSLRKKIIERSIELDRSPQDVSRALFALNRMSDERLAEIMEQLEQELGIGR